MLSILKYPYPFQAWLTIANDPDNTRIEDWRELNEFIWRHLSLPLANNLFVKSYNQNLPDQVNLCGHPEIQVQNHDTIHTWGDYMHAREVGFDRNNAIEACQILKEHKISPRVWIDHASFQGNLMHNSILGGMPKKKDMSGHIYTNYLYTLDLIKNLGIRYIWDGTITEIVGQDRSLTPRSYFADISPSCSKATLNYLMYYLLPNKNLRKSCGVNIPPNSQYYPKQFLDGTVMYCFPRYGNWSLADIYGLGKLVSKQTIDALIRNRGTMIVYTHLGKRPASKMDQDFHIPDTTKSALEYVKRQYIGQKLMITSTSELLDYLILRDNITWRPQSATLFFKPDGIRYLSISPADLHGKKFTFTLKDPSLAEHISAETTQTKISAEVIREEKNTFSIQF